MRAVRAAAMLIILPSSLLAQVTVRFSFDATPSATSGDAGTVIAERQLMRAWQDTVEVYLEQEASTANVRLISTPNTSSNFMVSIVTAPIPGKMYAYAIAGVLFEPGTLVNWKYSTHFVIYAENAHEAARALMQQTVAAINARNRRG